MSDMSVSSRESMSAPLDDLKQEQEDKLRQMRREYRQRESNEREASSAAISHIQKDTATRSEQIKDEADTRLKRESEQAQKSYAELKHRAIQQNENLQIQTQQARENSQHTISAVKSDEDRVFQQSQNELRNFVETQRKYKEQAREQSNADVQVTRQRGNDEIRAAKETADRNVTTVQAKSKTEVDEITKRNQATYNQAHAQSQQRLNRERMIDNDNITREREESSRDLGEIRRKYSDAVKTEKMTGERQLQEAEKHDAEQFRNERAHAVRTNEMMQAEYSSEAQRVQVTGEQDIHERQTHFDELKKEQKESNSTEIKNLEGQLTDQQMKVRKDAQTRMDFEAKRLQSALNESRKEFKTRYDTSDSTYKESLMNQKQMFLQELYKQKQKIDTRMGIEGDRADDPFYRLKTFDPQLNEYANSYELKARVAPHEKDSVDVIVKDNRITLSAKRAYADAFTDPEGSRTTTNSYQTYRQDFKLEKPVIASKVFHKVDDDGNITVIVPKVGSPPVT